MVKIVIRSTSPDGKRGWKPVTDETRGSFYLVSGSRRKKGGNTLAGARLAAQAWQQELRDGKPSTPVVTLGKGTSITVAARDYLLEIQAQKAPTTLVSYRRAVNLFAESCEKTRVDEITRTDLLAFITYLRSLRKKDGSLLLGERSVNHTLLKTAIFLKASGVPKLLKASDWPRYSEPAVKFYTREQIAALFAACQDEKEWLVVAFLLMTGMRRGETQHAEKSDIDFVGKVIRVQDKPRQGWHSKTWECREIPIPDELCTALQDLESGFIFRNKKGGMTAKNDLYKAVKSIARRAKVSVADLHTFRRTFGTMWVEKAPIQIVQKIMGHKSVETTMRYLGVADLRNAETRTRVASVFGIHIVGASNAA